MLISTVKREFKRIQNLPFVLDKNPRAKDKKLSQAALERLTMWAKRCISYAHFDHPPVRQVLNPEQFNFYEFPAVMKAFNKILKLSEDDGKLAYAMFVSIVGELIVNYAPKKIDSMELTVSNVNDAVRSNFKTEAQILYSLLKIRSPIEKVRKSKSKKSKKSKSRKSKKSKKRCPSGKHYRHSYRSASGKRVRAKCVRNSRTRM